MKRLALLVATLAGTLAAALAVIGTPAALAASTPTVTTGAATGLTYTSSTMMDTATLSGTVNMNGTALAALDLSSTCYFEYGPTTSYGSMAACASPGPTSAGTTTMPVTAALTGLTPGSTYHYALVVVTGGLLGLATTPNPGADATFTTPTATPPTVAATAPSVVGGNSATLTGTVNPDSNTVVSCSFSYTTSGATAKTASCGTTPSGATAQAVTAAVTGLTAGTAYTYTVSITYGTGTGTTLSSTNSGSFTTLSAVVSAPGNLTSTTATLTGSVNPEGQTIAGCNLYYGTAVASLTKVACAQAPASITGTSAVAVSANITGLVQSTEYLDTVILTTSSGATVEAPLGTFTTAATPVAPTATTTAATDVTATTATLHATVDAGGQGVRGCEFEWSVSPLPATSTPASDVALTELCAATPSDSGDQSVSVTLKGLAPGTVYYVRVLFLTYGGYKIANTVSFTTLKSVTTTKPAAKLASYSVNKRTGVAKFKIARTGSVAVTKGFECALVKVTKGKAGAAHYATCSPLKTYQKLKTGTYVFYARGGNKYGYGAAVGHKFTI